MTTAVATLIREVVYLDPDTGYTTRYSHAFSETGNNPISVSEAGVFWYDDDLYTIVPWHRVRIVRDYRPESRAETVEF